MTTITNKFLKFKPMIKLPIVANYTFFTAITFSNINSSIKINSIVIYNFIRTIHQNRKTNIHQTQKNCHQDNLSFVC